MTAPWYRSAIMVDVALRGFSSIFVENLQIEPELVGTALKFEHEGHAVELRLPLELEGRDYYSCSRRSRDGNPVTLEVNRVHLRVTLGETIDFPTELLGQQVNASGIPPETQERLDTHAFAYARMAKTIYGRFLRVVRWKMLNGALGRNVEQNERVMTYLKDDASDRDVWVKSGYFTVPYARPITPPIWSEIEGALRAGGAPIYFDLLFDAEQHFEAENLNRCVLETAIACEVCIKERINKTLPAGLSRSIEKAIERAHMPEQMKFLSESIDGRELTQFEALKPSLRKLISARNVVAHTGSNDKLTDEQCLEFLDTARQLLVLGAQRFEKFRPMYARTFAGIEFTKRPLRT